jgi:hypothetical protein
MTASFRTSLGVLALSLVALAGHAQTERRLEDEDLHQYLTRMGMGCATESMQAQLKLPNPCPFEKRLTRQLSTLSAERSVETYLIRNDFNCEHRKHDMICQYKWTYVFSPILYGVRVNPDSRNDFTLTIRLPAAPRALAADEISVKLRREQSSEAND